MDDERPEVECDSCSGEGFLQSAAPFPRMGPDCPDCNGTGYRPTTDDELNDMAEAAWERAQEGEPPLSLDEQHRMAWEEKRRLRR